VPSWAFITAWSANCVNPRRCSPRRRTSLLNNDHGLNLLPNLNGDIAIAGATGHWTVSDLRLVRERGSGCTPDRPTIHVFGSGGDDHIQIMLGGINTDLLVRLAAGTGNDVKPFTPVALASKVREVPNKKKGTPSFFSETAGGDRQSGPAL
jgi:hypothetical protein